MCLSPISLQQLTMFSYPAWNRPKLQQAVVSETYEKARYNNLQILRKKEERRYPIDMVYPWYILSIYQVYT